MNRLERIRRQLPVYGLDALLITGETAEAYALDFRGEGVVLLSGGACHYYTDSRYLESAVKQCSDCCEIHCVGGGRTHVDLAAAEIRRQDLRRVGFQDECMTLRAFRRWREALGERVELVPAGEIVLSLRASKDAEELARMRRAQAITDQVFQEILNDLRPGVTEREIAARLTFYQMRLGAQRNSFDPVVVSGPNGSLPHGIPGGRALREGEFVTMDFGCVVDGYCSDMTRTVAIGRPTEEMERVYHTVLEAQRAGIAAARAGVRGCEVDAAARAVIEAAGCGPYFGHSFGHSLGLEIHESPNFSPSCRDTIPAGAVLSAEPGIYLPGRFGVRIEDVLYLTPDGCEDITDAPKELIVL